jgi:hypothetical protein
MASYTLSPSGFVPLTLSNPTPRFYDDHACDISATEHRALPSGAVHRQTPAAYDLLDPPA